MAFFSRFTLCELYSKTSKEGLERRQGDGWAFWDMKAGSKAEDTARLKRGWRWLDAQVE